MRGKRIEVSIALSMTLILLGVLLPQPLMSSGNGHPACCSNIVEFKAGYEYISPKVPEVRILLFYKIYYVGQDGKPCEPFATPSDAMKIKNVTKNSSPKEIVFPKMFKNKFRFPRLGVYENIPGGLLVVVKKNKKGNYRDKYKLRLIAKGDHDNCKTETKEVTVKIVKPGTVADIRCTYQAELGFWIGNLSAGPGVVIKSIENPSPQPNSSEKLAITINVKLNGTKHMSLKPGEKTNVFNGLSPNDNWIIEIPNKRQYEQYVKTKNPLCVKAQLMCVSP